MVAISLDCEGAVLVWGVAYGEQGISRDMRESGASANHVGHV